MIQKIFDCDDGVSLLDDLCDFARDRARQNGEDMATIAVVVVTRRGSEGHGEIAITGSRDPDLGLIALSELAKAFGGEVEVTEIEEQGPPFPSANTAGVH
jgi:hypothetical protein